MLSSQPKVPGARQHGAPAVQPRRARLPPCKFATGLDIMSAAHMLQQEVMAEGVFHVTSAQMGQCLERFTDLQEGLPAPALPAPAPGALAAAGPGGGSVASISSSARAERVVNEAMCLATPPDNPERLPTPGSSLRSAAAASPASSARGGATAAPQQAPPSESVAAEAEDLARMEAAATQRAYLAHCVYSSEALRASAAIRRQRRRVLLRALRSGKQAASDTLAALAATPPGQLLATLSSWDE